MILHDITNGHPSIHFFKVLLDEFESGRELAESDMTAVLSPWLVAPRLPEIAAPRLSEVAAPRLSEVAALRLLEVVTPRLPLENEEDNLAIEENNSANQENNPAIEEADSVIKDDHAIKDLDFATKKDDWENESREQTNPHSWDFVYLIHEGDTTFYKISMSLDPQIRLKALQTANPRHLHLIKTQEVQDMRKAELSLHKQFKAYRVPNINVREWFDFVGGTGEVETAFNTIGQRKRRRVSDD